MNAPTIEQGGGCQLGIRDDCPEPAAYLLTWEDDLCNPARGCIEHTAAFRACDPLDTLESVVSLRRSDSEVQQ